MARVARERSTETALREVAEWGLAGMTFDGRHLAVRGITPDAILGPEDQELPGQWASALSSSEERARVGIYRGAGEAATSYVLRGGRYISPEERRIEEAVREMFGDEAVPGAYERAEASARKSLAERLMEYRRERV